MSVRTYSHNEILQFLESVVSGREDYVYDQQTPDGTCQYRNEDGSPSCIVGHWFDHIGLLEEIIGDATENAYINTRELTDVELTDRMEESGVKLGADAFIMLAHAQMQQDMGETWGAALASAKAAVERHWGRMYGI